MLGEATWLTPGRPLGVRSGQKHICWPPSQYPFLYLSIAFQKASTPVGPESSGRQNTRDHKESSGMKWLAPRPTNCVMEAESYVIPCGQGDNSKNSSPLMITKTSTDKTPDTPTRPYSFSPNQLLLCPWAALFSHRRLPSHWVFTIRTETNFSFGCSYEWQRECPTLFGT